ncbi:T9SS type A sorting domain-containing protein [uncultured Psychroserpens sp.]|uniref:T9SS type A sorting domain-containing protein n=1 Tax=uncultured Psychroserpens sp. TaxID=255436 RepID=UPI002622CDC3|nr:T9SS type A sorting domain-containing protein [uncultured Psychroserpens sp.]
MIAFLLGFQMSFAQTDTPCEGAQRWTEGSTWLPDGSIDDAPNAAFPNGIIRCGSSAETQSQIMPYNNSIYDDTQFEIDISGIPCFDLSTQTTVFPDNPTNGQPIIWLNFDVRAFAGSFEIQINDNSGDTIAWALYSSNVHQAGTSPAPNGQELSGDCGDLKRIACGVESSSTWNSIPIEGEDFLEPANMYLAVWDQDADGDLAINNFKARFGCGDSDVVICSLSVEDPVVSCAENGTYSVTVPINGANGQYTAIDSNAISISSDVCLGNLGGGAISGSFTLTYNQGTDYNIDISPVIPSTNGCEDPINPTQCTQNVAGVSPPPGTDDILDTATVCSGDSYLWSIDGNSYSIADSPVELNLIDANDCPYTATLTISEYPITLDDAASGEICEGETFNYEGIEYAVGSHDIPRTDANDCPYKTVLTVTAYPVTPDDAASGEVCEGETFNYEGIEYAVGSHDIPRTDANGCPYKTVLTVTAYPVTPDDAASGEICEGETFNYEGIEYAVGSHDIPRTDANGCPYKTVLTVTAYPVTPDDAASGEVCEGETFNYEGIEYTVGSHDIPRTDANGCPYKTVLTVTAYPVTPDDAASGEVCEGETFNYEGIEYAVGSHDIPRTDTNGCPYKTVLTVTAYPVTPDDAASGEICEGGTFNYEGIEYAVGSHDIPRTDANGCPYKTVLTVTAYPVTPDDAASGEVCEGETFNYEGIEYAVGSHDIPRTDANGCPYKTVLTVTAYPVTPDIADEVTICEGDSYLWAVDGQTYTVSDSPVELDLIDGNGCPYSATLTITEDDAPDAGEDGSLTVCEGVIPTDDELFDALEGTPDLGGQWSGPVNDVYTYTFAASGSCPEVSATVTVNTYPVTPDDAASGEVCEGETFNYEGIEYVVGSYDIPRTDTNGCPYKTVLTVTAYPVTPDDAASGEVCEGDKYTYEGVEYEVGVYDIPRTDANGCPYKTVLTVTAYPVTPDDAASGEVCEGETFNYEGIEYGVGSYDIAQTDTNGCPYITVLTVTAYPVTPDDAASGEVCEGETFNYEGIEYAVGSHDIAKIDANGCPYKTVLTVTAYPVTPDIVDDVTICEGDSYLWAVDGQTYTVSDSPVELDLINVNGCPYSATLTITEDDAPDAGEDGSLTVCEGVIPTDDELFDALEGTPDLGGQWSGPVDDVYTYTFAASGSCPEVSATVTVNTYPVTPDDAASGEVCEGETFNYEGIEYAVGSHDIPRTDTNGCPYKTVLTVTAYPVTPDDAASGEVCEGETFNYEGIEYAVGSHDIPKTDTNGCPYKTVLTVTAFEATDDIEDNVTICKEDSYLWSVNGETYTAADSPVILNLFDVNGCPYTATLIIEEEIAQNAGEDGVLEVCAGVVPTFVELFDALGGTPNEGGIWSGPIDGMYKYMFEASGSCPEVSATVTVIEFEVTEDIEDSVMVCSGESYTWLVDGEMYTVGDSPVEIERVDANGCTYNATLIITEHPITENIEDEVSVCGDETYIWSVDGETYTAADSPIVLDLFDSNGCSYTATLIINQGNGSYAGENGILTVCAGEVPTFEELFEALGGNPDVGGIWTGPVNGEYTYTFEGSQACPGSSAIVKVYEYAKTKNIKEEVFVCEEDGYTWAIDNTIYYAEDSPVVLYLDDENGCPYTATLIINEYPVPDDIYEEVLICKGETYTWDFNGITYSALDSPVVIEVVEENGCKYTATLVINDTSTMEIKHLSLDSVCVEDGLVPLSGGFPSYGHYSGEGVSDDGDGTYSFNPAELGPGIHPIFFGYSTSSSCDYNMLIKIEVFDCCEDEIAYAHSPNPGGDLEWCFFDSNMLYNANWGWTNGELDLESTDEFGNYYTYEFDLYAGSEDDCDPTDENSPGILVGSVTLERDGDNIIVTYEIDDNGTSLNYQLGDVNVYAGCNPHPCKSDPSRLSGNGNSNRLCASTIDVEEYPYSGSSSDGNTATIVFSVDDIQIKDCLGNFYFIAHADVEICQTFGEEEEIKKRDQNDFTVDFKAYPMPYTKEVNIACEFDFETDISIQVMDIRGVLLRNVVVKGYHKNTESITTLDLSDINDQILFVKLTTNKGSVIKKIISSNKK